MRNLKSPAADDTVELLDDADGVGVKYRHRRRFCGKYCRLGLVGLLIFLAVAGIVFGVVWILTRHHGNTTKSVKSSVTSKDHGNTTKSIKPTVISKDHDSTTKSVKPSVISEAPKICKTALCYNISRDISNQLNKSVNPCDDFYSYACGGFFKSHKLGPKEGKVNAFTILNKDNLNVLRNALQNSSQTYSQSSSIQKTIKIYDSCVDTTSINKQGTEPLKKLIETYGGWTVTGKKRNWLPVADKMAKVLRDLNVQTMLAVKVRTDLYNSNKNILQISPSQLGMSWSYYKDSYENEKIQKAYKTYMKTIPQLLGGDRYTVGRRMDEIYNFEKQLAGAYYETETFSEDLVETVRQYHRSGRSLDSLEKTLGDFIYVSGFQSTFMLKFLNIAFFNQKKSFRSNEKVIYLHKTGGAAPIFSSIYNTYLTSSPDVVQNYIMWQVVSKYVSSMPDAFIEAKRKYAEAVLGVQQYQRWSACIGGMMQPMAMTLGRMFVDAHFDENTKSTVKDMTSRIRKSFINNLDSKDWMDSSTKHAAKEKANAIKEDIGYPSFIKDDSELDAHYSMLSIGNKFFENTVEMNKMLIQKNLGMLGHPVNRDKWGMGPAQINGYYSPQQNRIVFLAGILQSPFYKKNYPKYFNYASLGMVVGHEVTHGFDSTGRLFDKNGNVKDWWTKSSTLKFARKAMCLVNQYNDYEVFGEYINGKKTLNENIADNGGIKLAYHAYKSWVSDNGKEGQLPDLDLSVDQLFFIGFAMPWCSVYKKEAALFQLKSDVHSYNKYRVIGSLSNFERFSNAFKCSSYSNMNRVDKCAVW